ncbi:UNVERIFIED_CONTAM: hypothetical protein Sindi_2698100 [Sesamum indicum]
MKILGKISHTAHGYKNQLQLGVEYCLGAWLALPTAINNQRQDHGCAEGEEANSRGPITRQWKAKDMDRFVEQNQNCPAAEGDPMGTDVMLLEP